MCVCESEQQGLVWASRRAVCVCVCVCVCACERRVSVGCLLAVCVRVAAGMTVTGESLVAQDIDL